MSGIALIIRTVFRSLTFTWGCVAIRGTIMDPSGSNALKILMFCIGVSCVISPLWERPSEGDAQ